MKKLFKNATVLSGEHILPQHSVLVDGDRIVNVAEKINESADTEVIDLDGDYLMPGFIDLQINGGGGSFFTKDLDENSLETIYKSHLKCGTTSYLPTLISTSMENIQTGIKVTKKAMEEGKYGVLGLHIEGPFFNPIKKGAHFEKFIHSPSDDEINLFTKDSDTIKLMTLAPEVVKSEQIVKLVQSGIKVSAGHSNASFDEAIEGFAAGITKVTHLYNAMSQLNSRNPGLVGAYLNSNDTWGAIIVDGIHVDLASVRLAYRLKKGRLFLVSDASFIEHPVNEFEFDGFKIHYDNGNYYTDDDKLAGSSISMHDAFKKCVDEVGISIFETMQMSSTFPARYLGIENEYGHIKKGYKADLVILDRFLDIKKVIKNGKVIEKKEACLV